MKIFLRLFIRNMVLLAALLAVSVKCGVYRYYAKSLYIMVIVICAVLNVIVSFVRTLNRGHKLGKE